MNLTGKTLFLPSYFEELHLQNISQTPDYDQTQTMAAKGMQSLSRGLRTLRSLNSSTRDPLLVWIHAFTELNKC